MFKPNNQPYLFTFQNQILNNEQQKLLGKEPEKPFCNLIKKINCLNTSKKQMLLN